MAFRSGLAVWFWEAKQGFLFQYPWPFVDSGSWLISDGLSFLWGLLRTLVESQSMWRACWPTDPKGPKATHWIRSWHAHSNDNISGRERQLSPLRARLSKATKPNQDKRVCATAASQLRFLNPKCKKIVADGQRNRLALEEEFARTGHSWL